MLVSVGWRLAPGEEFGESPAAAIEESSTNSCQRRPAMGRACNSDDDTVVVIAGVSGAECGREAAVGGGLADWIAKRTASVARETARPAEAAAMRGLTVGVKTVTGCGVSAMRDGLGRGDAGMGRVRSDSVATVAEITAGCVEGVSRGDCAALR
jgi:hypothetical protein